MKQRLTTKDDSTNHLVQHLKDPFIWAAIIFLIAILSSGYVRAQQAVTGFHAECDFAEHTGIVVAYHCGEGPDLVNRDISKVNWLSICDVEFTGKTIIGSMAKTTTLIDSQQFTNAITIEVWV